MQLPFIPSHRTIITTMSKTTAKDHARIIWFLRLRSALRTAAACAAVGGASLYGPTSLRSQITFPALSYVVVVLILSPATTLGHALSGCWHTLHATCQVLPLAVLARWLFSPAEGGRLPAGVAAMAAAMAAAFLAALPASTHPTAKRIALAQIALVCTEVAVSSDVGTTRGVMNPVHVAASAALGASACLLALLLPFPGLAHHKVQKLCKIYAENASERMDIYLRAFDASNFNAKIELVLQAKSVAEMGSNILQGVKILQEGMPWEKPWSESFDVEKLLQSVELPLRAMEYSLLSPPPPVEASSDNQQPPSTDSLALSSKLHKKIKKIRRFSFSDSQTGDVDKLAKAPHNKPLDDLACFFSSCVEMLLLKTESKSSTRIYFVSGVTLEPAIKYAVALGSSVLLSIILEGRNAIWASLMVATSFSGGRPAIFTAGNARAQGTAVGSVYGVLCCIVFRKTEARLFALLPWIVFSTFLKHSKMYGPPGGVSAAVAALFILGRRDYGDSNEFAIGRLTSVFVGVFCLLLVEVVSHPVRASTLAKRQMSSTLVSLREVMKETRVDGGHAGSKLEKFVERWRVLKCLVGEAELEPGFWYLPIHAACYKKAVGCLGNVVSLLHVVVCNLEVLERLDERKEFEERLSYEMEVLQGTVDSSLERVSLIESTSVSGDDVEAGEPEKLMSSGLMIIGEEGEVDEEVRERLVRCLGALGFCIASLRKEIDGIQICMKEIIRWEGSSTR